MSAQPVEKVTSTARDELVIADPIEDGHDEPFDSSVDPAEAPEPVEVRRNAVLSLVIGGSASAIAIAYLGRAVGTGAPLDWLLCALMAALATLFLRGLLDSRTPLLVADELGVRIRLGSQWRGLPWEAMERVMVTPRRGLRDGRLVLRLHHQARAIEGLEGRARRHAALNERLYGAALAVPLGLTTKSNAAADHVIGERLAELAGERAPVLTVLTDPAAVRSGVEAPVSAAPVPAETDDDPGDATGPRRSRWRLRPTVTLRPPSDREEPVAAPERSGEPLGRLARAIPFRVSGRGTRVEERIEELAEIPTASWAPPVAPVTPLARPGDALAPLVIDDFQPQPAYDPVIGPDLAAARSRVGLSVDQLAERTRIRPHVIESIEVDDFTPCGGDFYARGHIRTLARVLGKDPVPLLARFEERYAGAPVSARRVFEAEMSTGLTGSIRSTSGGPNWSLLVGAVLLLVLVWSGARLFADDTNALMENPPPVLNGSAGLTDVYGTPEPGQQTPTVEVVLTAVNAGTAVEVRDGSGELVFGGDLVIGEVKTVRAVPPVTVSADNGGALSVALGGEDLGLLADEIDVPATRTFQAAQD